MIAWGLNGCMDIGLSEGFIKPCCFNFFMIGYKQNLAGCYLRVVGNRNTHLHDSRYHISNFPNVFVGFNEMSFYNLEKSYLGGKRSTGSKDSPFDEYMAGDPDFDHLEARCD